MSNDRLTFLFTAYEDETLPNILLRLAPRLGYGSGALCLTGLTGLRYLDMFQGHTPRGYREVAQLLGQTPETIVREHTLAYYYEAAHPSPEPGRFRVLIAQGKLRARRAWRRQRPRFCLACIEEDAAVLGEPYMHRAHQLPGVAVCARHRQWLTWSCAQCGWSTSLKRLEAVRSSCPNGHALRPSKPTDAFPMWVELDFCRWSQELLSFEPDERRSSLLLALRGVAAEAGLTKRMDWQAQVQQLLRSQTHPALANAGRLLARATPVKYSTATSLMDGSLARRRPHPAAVLLCVKALLGPDANVLDALRDPEPHLLSLRRLWHMLPPNRPELRADLLTEHVLRGRILDGSLQQFDARVAGELGISERTVKFYRQKYHAIADALRAIRPPGARFGPKRSIEELVAAAKRTLAGINARTARQLETSFAATQGLTLSGLRHRLASSPKLFKCFKQLRPELYTQGRLLFLLTNLKRFPHRASGSTRAEYERNLATFLGMGVPQLREHKRRYSEFVDELRKARPDLYLSSVEARAAKHAAEDKQWMKVLRRWYRRTAGNNIAEFETNLAARCGVGGKQVYLARVRSPAFQQLLRDLRPDIYAEGSRSKRVTELSAQKACRRLKKVGPSTPGTATYGVTELSAQEVWKRIKKVGLSTPGTAIYKYEANLAAQLGRSGDWLARLRAKDAKVRTLLRRLRPDLYECPSGIRGPKFPLDEFLKCVEYYGATTPGATVFEYENNLARLIGRDGRRVAEVRRRNPKVAKLLARCKPALYSDWRCGRKRQRGGSA